MTHRDLPVLFSNAEHRLGAPLAALRRGDGGLAEALACADEFREAGVVGYLLTGNAAALAEGLVRSAQVCAAAVRGAPSVRLPASAAGVFFDAVCVDFALAREVAAALDTEWRAGEGYEEDAAYLRLLVHLLANDAEAAAGDARQFEAIVGPDVPPRLAVGHALLGEGDFHPALSGFLLAEAREVQGLYDLAAIPAEAVATRGAVSVEGTALLRIATALRLPADGRYRGIPPLRALVPRSADPDGWRRGTDGLIP